LQSKAVILCKNSKSIDDASILIINNAPKMIFYSTDNQIYGSIIKENYIEWKYLKYLRLIRAADELLRIVRLMIMVTGVAIKML